MEEIRTFVMGDVHGAGLELQALLEQEKVRPGIDRVYLVGDLFDRGKHGHVVWDLIKKYNIGITRGNHEQKFLKFLNHRITSVPPHYYWALNNLIDHGVKIEEFYNFLIQTELLINLDNVIIAHAGVCVYNPLQEDESANIYGSGLPQNLSKVIDPDDGKYHWWDNYDGDHLVLYGHLSSHDRLPRYRKNFLGNINSIGLDTATVHGGPITAYVIEENRICTYQSGKDYFTELKEEFKKNPPKPYPQILNWIKENSQKASINYISNS